MGKGSQQVQLIFAKLKANMAEAMVELPAIIGNEVVNYSLEAFDKQGWNGAPWKKRQSKKDTGRAILTGPGAVLRRSIRVVRSTPNSVTVGTDIIYAAIHNDGGAITRQAHSDTFVRPRFVRGERKGKFRAMTRREKESAPAKGFSFKEYQIHMPQRRYLGITPELIKRVRRVANEHINHFIKR